MNILAVIPARAGSKGIPRKNVRFIGGRPLISYAVGNAVNSKHITHTAVSTDDAEVKRIALQAGVTVIDRPAELCEDHVTLDSVIYHAAEEMKRITGIEFDIVITMQPTSPLLTTDVLDAAIEQHLSSGVDTTISGVNEPHLAWGEKDGECYPLYEKRVNRQYLPKHMSETGAFVITKGEFVKPDGRFGKKISIFETPPAQSIDIDTWQDWVLTEANMKRKNILFRVDGYNEIGTGHIYRALLFAYNLTEHNILFCLNRKSDIGIEKIKNSFFKYVVIDDDSELPELIRNNSIDIVVSDILDTSAEYMELVKSTGVRTVNFEDLGEGGRLADAVVNALYEKQFDDKSYFWGRDYYCIRDEFLITESKEFSEQVTNVLIMFGGTDPCDLTRKLFSAVKALALPDIKYTFVLGLGYKKHKEFMDEVERSGLNIEVVQNVSNISSYMSRADIAVSSQGRTMFELASMHVPTIIIAQNERELTHGFGNMQNGFLNLGLGTDVDADTIASTLKWLIETPVIRRNMYMRMQRLDLLHGRDRVKSIIVGE